ncbi:MAG: extracellular solute-binding protein [Cohaesibacteraceae bacterium]
MTQRAGKTPSLPVTRRTVLKGAGAAALMAGLPAVATAQSGVTRSHGLSSFGELALPPDFEAFPHVNLDAPKGGTLSFQPGSFLFNQNPQTFNTLNGFVLRGAAPPRIEITFDSLMKTTGDEPDAVYGLLAEWVEFSDDRLTYDFKIRSEARFHDGSPVLASDVAWSIQTLQEEGHPQLANLLVDVAAVELPADDVVRVVFRPTRSRNAHLNVVGVPIFKADWFDGKEFGASTLDPIMSSGAYRVGDFEAGRVIRYERVPDYWGRDLPVNRGQHNFDSIRIPFFRDQDVAFEAFKAGETNVREEFSSRIWATEYTFPAVTSGEILRTEDMIDGRPSGAQGFFFNTRLEKFSDPKVREALGLLFDFEWSNDRLFFGLYDRTQSMFENSPFKAEGMPSPEELALLEPFRDQLPEAVFGEPYVPPVSDRSGADRTLQREANRLLNEAGWTLEDGRRVNSDGEQFVIEFLLRGALFERIVNPYIQNLERLGISASLRTVDGAQFQSRLRTFDFDITVRRYSFTLTPGASLRTIIGSASANEEGAWNIAGIADPALDALIEQAGQAEARDELYIIMRAMDRILRSGHYWVPQWFKPNHWMAHQTSIGFPETKPRFALPIESHWWMEEA